MIYFILMKADIIQFKLISDWMILKYEVYIYNIYNNLLSFYYMNNALNETKYNIGFLEVEGG